MSTLNQTPSAERVHIAFFGRRNVGKSSLVNAFTAQEISIVSDVKGTTTDPVSKAMELLPMGPVLIIDTPGVDDEGTLGQKRVEKTKQILHKTDLAVVVTDGTVTKADEELLALIGSKNIPHILAHNKADLLQKIPAQTENTIWVSAKTGLNVQGLRELAAQTCVRETPKQPLVSDLVSRGDVVVLVTPIDASAPKGRLILPQQMVIRDLLDAGATAFVTKETELAETLEKLKDTPKLVITDSQVFGKVAKIVPPTVLLTSFSILMARYKGSLRAAVAGAKVVDSLQNGDKVLIAEGCSHHRQCEDIGTVKIPKWIREKLQVEPCFTFTSGGTFPEDLSRYKLVVHCGGCMLPEKEVRFRMANAKEQGIPVTNYGILIAYLNGILKRSVAPLPDMAELL